MSIFFRGVLAQGWLAKAGVLRSSGLQGGMVRCEGAGKPGDNPFIGSNVTDAEVYFICAGGSGTAIHDIPRCLLGLSRVLLEFRAAIGGQTVNGC